MNFSACPLHAPVHTVEIDVAQSSSFVPHPLAMVCDRPAAFVLGRSIGMRSPLTIQTTVSAILVVWSPIRSRFSGTKQKMCAE